MRDERDDPREQRAQERMLREDDRERVARHTPATRSIPRPLTGEARVLDMADRMRRLGPGGVQPHRLHWEALRAAERREIDMSVVGGLYRHAMIHAGAIVPVGRDRFYACPECAAGLDVPTDPTDWASAGGVEFGHSGRQPGRTG